MATPSAPAFELARAQFWTRVANCRAEEACRGAFAVGGPAWGRVRADGGADALLRALERLQQRGDGAPSAAAAAAAAAAASPPLPLRCHTTDPRRLEFPDGAVLGADADPERARAFLAPAATASAAGCELALRVGLVRLLLRFPGLIETTPALVEASVAFVTRGAIVRKRTRAVACAEARATRAFARLLCRWLKATHRDDCDLFTDAVVAPALKALDAPASKPKHLDAALRVLIAAPAVRVANHPEAHRIAACVPRLRNRKLVALAERLTRRVGHPDALDFTHEHASAFARA